MKSIVMKSKIVMEYLDVRVVASDCYDPECALVHANIVLNFGGGAVVANLSLWDPEAQGALGQAMDCAINLERKPVILQIGNASDSQTCFIALTLYDLETARLIQTAIEDVRQMTLRDLCS